MARCDGDYAQRVRGNAPDHADAVPVRLQSDGDNNSYPTPPQIWLDDIQASTMFKSGKAAAFWPGKYPKLFNGGWSPTAAPLSGRILIPEASLPLLINGMALVGQPIGTVFQEGKTEAPAERGVSEKPPEPNVTEGSDANPKGAPSGKTASGAIDDPHALEEARSFAGSDTGAPGRPPKGIHLCENEFRTRVSRSACESTLHAEADY